MCAVNWVLIDVTRNSFELLFLFFLYSHHLLFCFAFRLYRFNHSFDCVLLRWFHLNLFFFSAVLTIGVGVDVCKIDSFCFRIRMFLDMKINTIHIECSHEIDGDRIIYMYQWRLWFKTQPINGTTINGECETLHALKMFNLFIKEKVQRKEIHHHHHHCHRIYLRHEDENQWVC